MNGLDLFSGIGGLSLALDPWVQTVAYCERDTYAQSVLLSRMAEGLLHNAPIWTDVQTLRGEMLPPIDIIFGGFPCQDISVAGAGKGLAGERSGLFFEIVRLIKECRPTFVFLENVPAIRTRGLHTVIEELSSLGFQCRWQMLSAAEVGANHKRERWFLLAYSDSAGLRDEQGRGIWSDRKRATVARYDGSKESLADTEGIGRSEGRSEPKGLERKLRLAGSRAPLADSKSNGRGPSVRMDADEIQRSDGANESEEQRGESASGIWGPAHWSVEPAIRRVVNGVSFRMERLKCLGNAVVPLQAREAFETLSGIRSVI